MSNNYIGHILKETRLKKQISASKLCAGLCSPSMLTRIESGERYPSKLLFDALMERMGESGKNYNFIGTAKEAEIYQLIQTITINHSQRNYDKLKDNIEHFRIIMNPKSALELQALYLFECILPENTSNPSYDKVISAINLTIKDFNLSKISYYMLSNHERLLLNILGCYYTSSKEYNKAINIFKSLYFFITQYDNFDCDILHISSIVRYNEIVCHLKKQDYKEMIYLCSKLIPQTISNHPEIVLGRLYYQHCYAKLALDKDCINEDFLLAYYTFLDIENTNYADFLKKDIYTDLGLNFEVSFY